MSNYAAYPEYRDSEVEWIGDVPTGWEVKRLKNVLRKPMKNGLFKKKDQFGSGSLLVNVSDLYVEGYFIDSSDLGRVQTSESERIDYVVEAGDLFFVRSSLKLEGIGRAACFMEEEENVVFECHIVNARPNKLCVSAKFLTRYVNSLPVAGELVRRSKTTTMTTIDQGGLATINVLVPTKKEQVKIDHFLDYQIRHIDTLIEKQQQLIKLLKEKRQAVISHAVTKGLNPDAPMKDSGVEWLGEVPVGWELQKLKHVSRIVRGGSPRPAGDPKLFNGDYSPWVTVAEITRDDEIYLEQTETFLTKLGSEQCRVFKAGTLVYSNSGATLGVPKILAIDANANDGVVGFERLTVDIIYVYYFLFFQILDLRERTKQGSGQPNLNTELVGNMEILLPPEKEISKILEKIGRFESTYRTLIARSDEVVRTLKERRTALISAAVTGKIDVRNWQLPDS